MSSSRYKSITPEGESCSKPRCGKTACWLTPKGKLVCVEHGNGVKGKTRPWRSNVRSVRANLYLITWKSRPAMQGEFRVYVNHNRAENFLGGLIRGGAVESAIQAFKVGQTVRLSREASRMHRCPEGRENHRTAVIGAFLLDINGGVHLERDLRGARYWHITDLEAV